MMVMVMVVMMVIAVMVVELIYGDCDNSIKNSNDYNNNLVLSIYQLQQKLTQFTPHHQLPLASY